VELTEIGEVVEAGEEESGVDGSGDGLADGHLGDDRDASDLRDVPGGEAPALLGEQDDATRRRSCSFQRGCEGEVARAPNDE
jgi:hypothetical protein